MNKEIKYDKNCDANYSCKECDDYKYFPCKCRYLQQENKQLKEINEEHRKLNGELREENKEQEEYIKYWQNEYDKKCEVIDKAIEYIENNIQEGYSEVYETEIHWDAVSVDELLEILKGE